MSGIGHVPCSRNLVIVFLQMIQKCGDPSAFATIHTGDPHALGVFGVIPSDSMLSTHLSIASCALGFVLHG